MKKRKFYDTYIFDFYGTLVDIHTDEQKPELWEKMAGIYSAYGADYKPEKLKDEYSRMCKEEEKHLVKVMKVWNPDIDLKYPEIDLTRVFARLLAEAEKTHEVKATISGKDIKLLRVEEIAQSEWAHMISNTFRVISRDRLSCYANTKKVLKTLKDNGCKAYLLSNAQASFTRSELEMVGVLPYLDGVYISSEKQMKKPQADFMEGLLKEFSIEKSKAVMVGNDLRSDMMIAKACGMKGIYLNTFELDNKTIDAQIKELGLNKKNIQIVADGDIGQLIK